MFLLLLVSMSQPLALGLSHQALDETACAALCLRTSHTLCPVWSRWRSGSAAPWDSGRAGRCGAGSPAAAPSCGGFGCMCTRGGVAGCRGDLALVSAGITQTHTEVTGMTFTGAFSTDQQTSSVTDTHLTLQLDLISVFMSYQNKRTKMSFTTFPHTV